MANHGNIPDALTRLAHATPPIDPADVREQTNANLLHPSDVAETAIPNVARWSQLSGKKTMSGRRVSRDPGSKSSLEATKRAGLSILGPKKQHPGSHATLTKQQAREIKRKKRNR